MLPSSTRRRVRSPSARFPPSRLHSPGAPALTGRRPAAYPARPRGFAALDVPEEVRRSQLKDNTGGWSEELGSLRTRAEAPVSA
jgi:hypothetical protein